MDTNMETDSIADTMDGEGGRDERPEEGKATYKSFKKKFRKIKVKFDEAMRLNNEYYMQEQNAAKTAKRLARENDQLLDLLLDQNNSAQMPIDKRIDLMSPAPSLTPIPPLMGDEELSSLAEVDSAEAHALQSEIKAILHERDRAQNAASKPPKSLAGLIQTVPHLSLENPLLPKDLLDSLEPEEGQPVQLSYLTPDQLDDYLDDIDSTTGAGPALPPTFSQPPPTPQDLAFANNHSPYNWLRKHVPNIFLQDGEGSEKSHGKPGALRGAGKRASIPAPSKPGALEFVEEDGLEYDASLTSAAVKAQTKRKRADDDDGGYHPKLGTPAEGKGKKARQPRKKKSDTSEETPPAPKGRGGRKSKARLAAEAAEVAAAAEA